MARPDSRRALRRHHRARLIRARVRQCRELGFGDWVQELEAGRLAWASLLVRCSCGLCRKWPVARHRPPAGWWEEDDAEGRFSRAEARL
jgi:hypothetical protein